MEDIKTVIGTNERVVVDKNTGEELVINHQITKWTYDGAKTFWKCYLMDFLNILGVIDSKQVDVFIYIVQNTNQANNMFIGTYRKIAAAVGVSHPTIATIMKKLQEHEFIEKIQNGVWLVNPNILVKGNDIKQRMILLSYRQHQQEQEHKGGEE